MGFLLASREVTYTPPTLTAHQRSLWALRNTDTEAAQLLADVWVDQIRFTFGQCSVPGMGRYRDYAQQASDYVRGDAKVDFEKLSQPQLTLLGVGYVWARAKATVTQVETRQVRVLDLDESTEGWVLSQWPAEWDTVEGFIATIPEILVHVFSEVTDDLNPGLWAARMGPEEKKLGGVSVK